MSIISRKNWKSKGSGPIDQPWATRNCSMAKLMLKWHVEDQNRDFFYRFSRFFSPWNRHILETKEFNAPHVAHGCHRPTKNTSTWNVQKAIQLEMKAENSLIPLNSLFKLFLLCFLIVFSGCPLFISNWVISNNIAKLLNVSSLFAKNIKNLKFLVKKLWFWPTVKDAVWLKLFFILFSSTIGEIL